MSSSRRLILFSAGANGTRVALLRSLAALGLFLAAAVAPAPTAAADDFPRMATGRPAFVADIIAFPAVPGSVAVEVSWEIPVRELTFRQELGYYRARYDVSVVCLHGKRQIGGELWERRIRVKNLEDTRSSTKFARGRERLTVPEGNFKARVEVRDQRLQTAAFAEGNVRADRAGLRIALGEVSLVRYTEAGGEPNPQGDAWIGDTSHRALVTLHTSDAVGERAYLEWEITAPDGRPTRRDTTVVVAAERVEVELPLDTRTLGPGRHRLSVKMPRRSGERRTAELQMRVSAEWFARNRRHTEELLEWVVGDEVSRLESAKGEEAWNEALEDFWAERDPDSATPRNEFRDELAARIELASTLFVEPFRRPGWRTDRGRVLLEHGEPPRRSVRPATDQSPASEFWEYDEPRRRFVFVDLRNSGEFLRDR